MPKMGANPRIDLAALPPGPIWWISKSAAVKNVIYTFQRDDTLTWFTANKHAEVYWREYMTNIHTPEMHRKRGHEIESAILYVLKEQQTTLWE